MELEIDKAKLLEIDPNKTYVIEVPGSYEMTDESLARASAKASSVIGAKVTVLPPGFKIAKEQFMTPNEIRKEKGLEPLKS